jgi:cytosine/adenosine deaminase-related metal-dependent hydrolase
MPPPARRPATFIEILENIWWRLDAALDFEMIRWSAMLGALEALESGTTAIVDHHESPNAIDGSLDVIADACGLVGVRVICAYGVTDRHGPEGARRGLAENERFIREGGRGMVGVHAAFTCRDATLEAAAGLARELGVGVHIHVAEGPVDRDAGTRLASLADEDWLLVHCVHLDRGVAGTIAHNPRSNMNNAVGYARPARFGNRVVLGTDGIGADMLEEFRLAYARLREDDVVATPEQPWSWLENGYDLVPEARNDRVTWSYDQVEDPWRAAFTTDVRPLEVVVDGEVVLKDGYATRVDAAEVRARAAEQAARLFKRL